MNRFVSSPRRFLPVARLVARLAVVAAPLPTVAIADVHVNAPEDLDVQPESAVAEYERGVASMQERNWAEAQRIFTALLEEHADYGAAWYQLAYCQLVGGDVENAARGWSRSAELRFLPAESRYNRACALALQGRTDAALDALEAAIEHGYSAIDAMTQDPDLASLREHERFRTLSRRDPLPASAGGTSVSFSSATEGRTVYGQLYLAEGEEPRDATTFLLFHQAGSNYAEYFPIAPRLARMGFNVLTIDALGGGARWGRENETVNAHGSRGGGEEAIEDFRGALSYLDREGYGGARVLWGSSYSVGRSLQLLSEGREDLVAGILFSGGRALSRELDDGTSLSAHIHVPVFLAAPIWEYDALRKASFDAIASENKWLYIPTTGGAHGSSMLREDTNPRGAEDAWRELTAFIERYVRGAGLASAEPSTR